MKQFLAGCAVGALAMALYDWPLREQAATATPAPEPDREISLLPDNDRAIGGLFPSQPSPSPTAANDGRNATERKPAETVLPEPEAPAAGESVSDDPARPHNPVNTSPQHQALLADVARQDQQPDSVAALHAEFEYQQPDLAWSYQAEQNLQAFLAGHTGISQFDIQHLECRQSLCELHVMGYGDHAGKHWDALLNDMAPEPWFLEFERVTTQSSGRDGQVVIVTILQRADYGGEPD